MKIIPKEVGLDLMLYDTEQDEVHVLNPTARLVYDFYKKGMTMAEITTDSNLGSTTIARGHSAVSGESGLTDSIFRYYQITPTTTSGLNATLKFYYNGDELNDIPEADLALFRWNGSKWQCNATNYNRDVDNDWIRQTGIDAFSKWTLGDEDDPTLVNLVSFTATGFEDYVLLEWDGADLVRFKLRFSSDPTFKKKVMVVPLDEKKRIVWIEEQFYTPSQKEWRGISRLG